MGAMMSGIGIFDGKKTNIEWAQEQMRAKTMSLSSEARGAFEGADWMDRCGALAAIKHEAAKALASIHVWPDRNRKQDEQVIIQALAQYMIEECARVSKKGPCKTDGMTLNDLATRTASMVLFLHLNDLRDHYTTKGRLHLANIPITDSSWRKTWKPFEDMLIERLMSWYTLADMYIGQYRDSMKAP